VRRLLLSAPLVVLVVVLSGCTPPNSTTTTAGGSARPGRAVYCTVIAEPPGKDGPGTSILGKGRYQCAATADSLTMNVTLQQRLTGGAWSPMVTRRFVATGAATTQKTTQTVAVPCNKGTFRTVVVSTVVSNGVAAKARTFNGPPVTDPCTKRF